MAMTIKPSRYTYTLLVTALLISGIFIYELFAAGINAETWVFRGDRAYRQQDYGEAEIFYRNILSLDPESRDVSRLKGIARYKLANTLYQQGRYLEAISGYQQFLKSYPQAAKSEKTRENDLHDRISAAYNNMGISFFHIGHLEESADSFKKALLLKQDDRQIRQNFLFLMNRLKMQQKNLAKKQDQTKASGQARQEGNNDQPGDQENAVKADLSGKETEALLDMVRHNEEMKKGRIGRLKKKPGKFKTDEKDY